jgi:DNA-binding GntR family transcriptional regulator
MRKQRGRTPYSETKARQIADDLQAAIEQGFYKQTEAIPTTAALVNIYKVGEHTITRVREILLDRNLILRPMRGRKTIVR